MNILNMFKKKNESKHISAKEAKEQAVINNNLKCEQQKIRELEKRIEQKQTDQEYISKMLDNIYEEIDKTVDEGNFNCSIRLDYSMSLLKICNPVIDSLRTNGFKVTILNSSPQYLLITWN